MTAPDADDETQPPGPRVFVGVALVSACVLVLQLALTRLFSATMYYHFAFLAISLALLGSGASGVFVYALQRRLGAPRDPRLLAVASALFGLASVVALFVILLNPISPVDPAATTFVRLAGIYAAAALPFFCAGVVVTLAVTRYARHIGRLYLFDLTGAALGCLLLIPLLNLLGAVNAVLVVALVAIAAAGLFESTRSGRRVLTPYLATAGVWLVLMLGENLVSRRIDVRQAKGVVESGHVIFSKWNSFSRVTVWGTLVDASVLIVIDADAATVLTRNAGSLTPRSGFGERLEALAYQVKTARRALIIGSGGGNDVVMARSLGARDVTAVEVNPIIAGDVMSSEPFRTYSGALYEQPGVRLVVDEGRSFIRGSAERYDVIQGTMVDTWAATAAGAFALTENNLYTVEAFKDYLTHLEDGGVLSMTRWYTEPPDQLMRLASLARQSLGEIGSAHAEGHVLLMSEGLGPGATRAVATFLLKRTPFDERELDAAEAFARRNGYHVLYSPRDRTPSDFRRILEAPDPAAVWSALTNDIAPPRDNNPFFFQTVRVRDLRRVFGAPEEWRKTNLGTFVLFVLLLLTLAFTLLCIFGPLALVRGRGSRPPLAPLLYFGCLGLGFILVEVALVQKCVLFLGHPVYSLAVVLFALLVFSGIGSALAGRCSEDRLVPTVTKVLLAVAVLVVVYILALSPIFYALVQIARPYRIALTVVLLAPLGVAMGMPMPLAIRFLASKTPAIVPWAWGVNGAASVMGSVAAVAIALTSGFNQALLVAAGFYLLAIPLVARPWTSMPLSAPRPATDQDSSIPLARA